MSADTPGVNKLHESLIGLSMIIQNLALLGDVESEVIAGGGGGCEPVRPRRDCTKDLHGNLFGGACLADLREVDLGKLFCGDYVKRC